MFGRASGACFGAALVLAGLALGAAALNEQSTEGSEFLDLLTIVFIIAASGFLVLSVIFGLIFVGVWAWRYLHAVEVLPGEWYFRFWPNEQTAQASGIAVRVYEWAGAVKVKCHARFGRDEVDSIAEITAGSNGTFWPGFPQQKVNLESDPYEGNVAWLVVKAWPSWWRGGQSERIQMVKIAVIDHRPAPIAVTPEQAREAIARIDPLIVEAQEILDACGRPHEQMRGAGPMYFQEVCIPRINQFARDATTTIQEVAPEFMGKFQNVGNVTQGTDVKPAMIQQVERWLENLGAIQDELRKRL